MSQMVELWLTETKSLATKLQASSRLEAVVQACFFDEDTVGQRSLGSWLRLHSAGLR